MPPIPPGARILYQEAQKQGLKPQWETGHGLFSIRFKRRIFYFYSTKLSINNSLGVWLTQDKYTTRVLLDKYKLPNIPYCYTTDKKELNHFFDQYHPLVGKPVLGERAEEVKYIEDREVIFKLPIKDTLFEQYIKGTEYRYLVLKGEIIGAQKKELASTPEYPWRKIISNLEKKGFKKEYRDLALKAAEIVSQQFLSVDFIERQDNSVVILELNSMPGLYSFHNPDLGKPKNIADLILQAILTT